MRVPSVFGVVAVAFTISGCGMTYKYSGRDFKSESEALAYQQEKLNDAALRMPKAPTRIGGVLRIYTVNQELVRQNMVTGNKDSKAADYVIKTIVADVRGLQRVLERRGGFDSVELLFGKGEHRVAEPPNHVVYFYSESESVGSWYYIGTKVPRTALSFDRGTSDLMERYKFLAETLESLALAEKIASKR